MAQTVREMLKESVLTLHCIVELVRICESMDLGILDLDSGEPLRSNQDPDFELEPHKIVFALTRAYSAGRQDERREQGVKVTREDENFLRYLTTDLRRMLERDQACRDFGETTLLTDSERERMEGQREELWDLVQRLDAALRAERWGGQMTLANEELELLRSVRGYLEWLQALDAERIEHGGQPLLDIGHRTLLSSDAEALERLIRRHTSAG